MTCPVLFSDVLQDILTAVFHCFPQSPGECRVNTLKVYHDYLLANVCFLLFMVIVPLIQGVTSEIETTAVFTHVGRNLKIVSSLVFCEVYTISYESERRAPGRGAWCQGHTAQSDELQ